MSKRKTDIQLKLEHFIRSYAAAYPSLSKPEQQRRAKKIWCEVKEDPEKYNQMLTDFKIKEKQSRGTLLQKWSNWSKPVHGAPPLLPQNTAPVQNENAEIVQSVPSTSQPSVINSETSNQTGQEGCVF